jgi:hypothetical protein
VIFPCLPLSLPAVTLTRSFFWNLNMNLIQKVKCKSQNDRLKKSKRKGFVLIKLGWFKPDGILSSLSHVVRGQDNMLFRLS